MQGWLVKTKIVDYKKAPTIVFYHENAGSKPKNPSKTTPEAQNSKLLIPLQQEQIRQELNYKEISNPIDIGTRLNFIQHLLKNLNVNFLIIAYRGYSYSEGEPNEPGIKLDGHAILDYAFSRKDLDTSKIIVFGRSLGGAVAINTLSHTNHKVLGAIIENTFTSIDAMVDKLFPMVAFLKGFVLRNHWRSIEVIGRVRVPILFIKAMNDELIPPAMMNKLYANAVSAKFKKMVNFFQKKK